MSTSVPNGITPPTPGLEREEPTFWIEDDIPTDDEPGAKPERGGRPGEGSGEERSPRKPERE